MTFDQFNRMVQYYREQGIKVEFSVVATALNGSVAHAETTEKPLDVWIDESHLLNSCNAVVYLGYRNEE